jgi:hypothetical protein
MKHLLLAFLVACGGSKGGETVSKIDGTATVDGKPAKITGCSIEKLTDGPPRAGVVVTLDTGLKYRHDPYAGARFSKGGEWEKGDCDKTAGNDTGGPDWSKGTLDISCKYGGAAIVIKATYDCGAVDRPTNRID